MTALLRGFGDIALFRAGPDRLPYSPALVVLLAIGYTAVNIAVTMFSIDNFGASAILSLFELTLLGGYIYLLLRWRRFGARYVQTISAILGCGLGFSLLGLPIIWAMTAAQERGGDLTAYSLFSLGLVVWRFMVGVHVLKCALQTSSHVSVALNLVYLLLSFQMTVMLLKALQVKL